ncbi:hypothetical protein MKW92_003691, partial [Papaver armeniacum]
VQGTRPAIPKETNTKLKELIKSCWEQDPELRPEFIEIAVSLRQITKEVRMTDFQLRW